MGEDVVELSWLNFNNTVMLSVSEFIPSIGDISFFEAFSMLRSSRDRARDKFAFASRFTLRYGTGRMTLPRSVAQARQNARSVRVCPSC